MKKIIFPLIILFLISVPVQAFEWPTNYIGGVSITGDDGWSSQIQQARILEQYGFRGTFYLSVGAIPSVITNKNSWKNIYEQGHEIGNHSYSHFSNLADKTWKQVASDAGNMEWWILSNIYSFIPTPHTYSFPYGNYIIGTQNNHQQKQVGACEYSALLSAIVSGARILSPETAENIPEDITKRKYYLKAKAIFGPDAVQKAIEQINNAIYNGTWVILTFHSLGDYGDGYSISESDYIEILEYLKNSPIWVAPVIEIKNYILENTPEQDWNCKLNN